MRRAAGSGPVTTFVLCCAAFVCAALTAGWVASAALIAAVLILPGAFVLSLLPSPPQWGVERVTLAVACSVVLYTVSGWVASVLGPLVGVSRPLDRGPQLVLVGVFLLFACVAERVRGVPVLPPAPSPRRAVRNGALFAVASLLPVAAVLGALSLARGNGPDIARGTAFAAWTALLAVLGWSFVAPRVRRTVPSWVLYPPSLAVLWASSLRSSHLFGWDIQKEFATASYTQLAGVWRIARPGDAYRSMLSVTSLPATLSSVSGVSVRTVLAAVFPLFLAALPVLTHRALAGRARSSVAAAVSVLMVAAAQSFAVQMPAIARQEVALFVFAAALLVVTGTMFTVSWRRRVAGALFASLGFLHYTSAYATVFMVAVAAVAGLLLAGRDRRLRTARVLTVPVAVAVAAVTFGWNVMIAPTGEIFDAPSRGLVDSGLSVLGNHENSLVGRWIAGTGARTVTVNEYGADLRRELDGDLYWMHADPAIARFTAEDRRAPTVIGPFASAAGAYDALRTVLRQLLVLLSVLAVAAAWLRRSWRRQLGVDVVGMLAAALALNSLLRLSSTAAQFYNPERAALHNALVLAPAVALLLEAFVRHVRPVAFAAAAAAAALSVGAWGVAPYVFAGDPPAATSGYGENVERFVVSTQELETARWVARNLTAADLLQSDRYGKVVMLSADTPDGVGAVDILHPEFIDRIAWVLATSPQVLDGRARGQRDGRFAVFSSPTARVAEVRATLYVTDETAVYR